MLFLGNALGLTLIFPVSILNGTTTGHPWAQHMQRHETQRIRDCRQHTVRLQLTQHAKCDWYMREQRDSRNMKSDNVRQEHTRKELPGRHG